MLYFLIAAVSGLSYDTVYTEDKNIQNYTCDSFKEICESCNTTTVYKIENLQDFQISGYLESTIFLVEDLLTDLSSYIQSEK